MDYKAFVQHQVNKVACYDTEDAFQDGFVGLMEAIDRYDPEKGRFTTFAGRRVLGAIIDGRRYWRSHCKSRLAEKFVYCTEVQPEMEAASAPDKLFAEEAMGPLTEQERHAIYCYYFVDMEMWKIGKKIGVSESAVSTIIKRSLEKMRKHLEKEEL
jgi:DNA-directed RNA polymerase